MNKACSGFEPDPSCATCPVRHLGTCRPVGDAALDALARRSHRSRYRAGQTILPQGEPSDRVGVVVAGMLKVTRMTADGEVQVLALLGPGDLVAAAPGEAETACEAATDLQMCWTTRAALETVYTARPELMHAHLDAVEAQLARQRRWMSRLRGRSSVERLAGWLLDAPVARATDGGPVIELTLSRRDLAGLLDMTVETFCRTLHHLADRGAIALLAPDRLVVADGRKLARLAGEAARGAEATARRAAAAPGPLSAVNAAGRRPLQRDRTDVGTREFRA